MHWIATPLLVAVAVVASLQTQTANDTVERLMPNGSPNAIVSLTPAQTIRAVKQPQAIQKQATGQRLLDVTFLLAAYGTDYDTNRDYLLHDLRGCTTATFASSDKYKYGCTDPVGDCLIVLYKRGHKELLVQLFLLGKDAANAVIQEGLGDFASTVLVDKPNDFLDAIRPLAQKLQRQMCYFAGSADGSGIGTQNLLIVRKSFTSIGDGVAQSCLQEVEAADWTCPQF